MTESARSPGSQDMVAAFDRNFDYLVGIKQSRGILNTNLYWNSTRSVLDSTGKFPVTYHTDPALNDRVAQLEIRELDLDFRNAQCRFLHNRPRFAESYILQAYMHLITHAQSEVLIANAYFVPTQALLTLLQDAAKRCVKITLVTNSPETNDLPEISMVGRGYYQQLLAFDDLPEVQACPGGEVKLEIWEWLGRSESDPVHQGTMHSKLAVADRRISLVGSYNLDPRSERLNSETALIFEQPELAAELVEAFIGDLGYSQRVTRAAAAEFADPQGPLYRFRKRH